MIYQRGTLGIYSIICDPRNHHELQEQQNINKNRDDYSVFPFPHRSIRKPPWIPLPKTVMPNSTKSTSPVNRKWIYAKRQRPPAASHSSACGIPQQNWDSHCIRSATMATASSRRSRGCWSSTALRTWNMGKTHENKASAMWGPSEMFVGWSHLTIVLRRLKFQPDSSSYKLSLLWGPSVWEEVERGEVSVNTFTVWCWKKRTKKRKYHACCQEERKTKTTYCVYI